MDSKTPPETRPLHGIFTEIPPRYDVVNHIITLGIDARWRRLAVAACLGGKPERILDIGCGTGDLSVSLAEKGSGSVAVTGLDYSETMLEAARAKAARAGVADKIAFVHGDAAGMPFPDGHFDVAAISFAFRNLTYQNPLREAHFAEVVRVLKPGGRYVIVESSQPENAVIRALFHVFLRCFVRPVGVLISGNPGAYRYLTESAARYYRHGEIREMLLKAGFKKVSYRPLFFGAAGLHVATR